MSTRPQQPRSVSLRFLRTAAIAFAIGFSLHALDHFRRGLSSSPTRVIVVGTIQSIVAVVAVWMVLKGRRGGAVMAIVAGFGSALLFTSGHLLPTSLDSYVTARDAGVTWFSWLTALSEIGTGLVFAIAGIRAVFSTKTHESNLEAA